MISGQRSDQQRYSPGYNSRPQKVPVAAKLMWIANIVNLVDPDLAGLTSGYVHLVAMLCSYTSSPLFAT